MTGVLVAVAGTAGSGKSRLAELIAGRLHAERLDVSRSIEPFPDAAAYTDVLARVEAGPDPRSALAVPRIVLVGPFHTRDSRARLSRAASASHSALLYVECWANEFVRRRRLRLRLMSGPDALTLPEAELWVERMISDDALFERTGIEIPRAAQMLVDTTVGIDIWGGLAASRVETWASHAPIVRPRTEEDQVVSAG